MIHVPRSVTAAAAVLALAVGVPGLAHAQPGDRIPPASPRPAAPAQSPAAPGGSALSGDTGDRLPEGWRLDGSGAERHLVWRAPKRLPMGNARVEFYAGDRLIGVPDAAADQRTFRLPLNGAGIGSPSELQAQAAGRRLDAGAEPAGPPPRIAPPAASSAPLPENRVDPGVPGDFRTVSGEYTLPSVRIPGFREPVEMRATVVGPTGATGKRPLALFLHGRHETCYKGDSATGSWPCKNGQKPVPSYRGYLHDQKLLASQGYVTVSISANGINGQDDIPDGGAQARSSLVRQHLGRWADWAAGQGAPPAAVRATAPVDTSRVLLVGHSRGGEGVDRAALDSLSPPPADQDGAPGPARWNIRGTVLIGPTIFGQNPTPDVPSMTILPGCDGDVSDLQGQLFADGTRGVSRGKALHSAVYMVGANHNYFNTEWTPGQAKAPASDDFYSEGSGNQDPVCAPGKPTRLKAKQQQKAGSTYIAAAARLFVGGDDRVRPLLDGSGRRAPSANPARVLTHAVGGNRTPAFVPGSALDVSGSGRLCAQVDDRASRACLPMSTKGSSPHFAVWSTSPEAGRQSVAMRWSQSGAATKVRPRKPVSLAGSKSLALRVIVPPNSKGTRLDVAVTDASGHRAKLGEVKADGLPGTERTSSYWGREVRVPLTAATRAGLDLTQVTSLELTPRTRSGRAWLVDGWGWRPGTPDAGTADLARVDIGRLKVKEGDSGVRTYQVPVRVSGHGTGKVRLFMVDPVTQKATARVVTVRAGGEHVDVPVTVRGNKRYDSDVSHEVLAKAVSGAVVGSYGGGVTVRNDDPMPKVTVTPVADRVTEGKPLKWRISLSAVADTPIETGFDIRPVSGGAKELSTKDVDKRWLKEVFGRSPNPQVPLSKVSDAPYIQTSVKAGERSVVVSVPTVKDRVREPKETLRLRLFTYDQSWNVHRGPTVTGTVRDPS
ncbi:hypothetical protein GPA10_26785 [Streptomyces sp. p1417]|uniref:RHD domain-containing protein n=1 Tax=Streptomyces typhae TaxID=2681492 RepID=A0A6L6X3T8_9ACTN|nr:hypothetical protein [Streptomyces typhae]MVO88270.1 hypothetical protein [Streptomyces typhae]